MTPTLGVCLRLFANGYAMTQLNLQPARPPDVFEDATAMVKVTNSRF